MLALIRSPQDNFAEAYGASLHWALTQFTPATNDIAPDNATGQERNHSKPATVFFVFQVREKHESARPKLVLVKIGANA